MDIRVGDKVILKNRKDVPYISLDEFCNGCSYKAECTIGTLVGSIAIIFSIGNEGYIVTPLTCKKKSAGIWIYSDEAERIDMLTDIEEGLFVI